MKPPLGVRVADRLRKRSPDSLILGKTPAQIPQLRARQTVRAEGLATLVTGRPAKGVAIEDIIVPLEARQLRARVYSSTADTGGDRRPVIVDYHGGGFVIGQPEMKEWLNSELSRRLGAIVVSVDYRLAPEHRFPAAFDDAVDSFLWIARNIGDRNGDPSRIALLGDSAGAALAAAASVELSRRSADTPRPLAQVLLYPATDLVNEYPSAIECADAPFLSVEESHAYVDHYCTMAERADPRISALLADDLGAVPATLVITAEHDPLRDQGHAFADALQCVGVDARATNYPGTAHGFMSTPGLYGGAPAAALAQIADELRRFLHVPAASTGPAVVGH